MQDEDAGSDVERPGVPLYSGKRYELKSDYFSRFACQLAPAFTVPSIDSPEIVPVYF